jgi:hypothetical protein
MYQEVKANHGKKGGGGKEKAAHTARFGNPRSQETQQ